MSELSKQLKSMRTAYRAEKYPGDLAAELLGAAAGHGLDPKADAERSRRPWRIWLATAAGIGAAVAAAITIVSLINRPGGTTMTPATVEGQEMAVHFEIPGPPEMPSGLPIAPPHVGLEELTGAPDFPSRFDTL